MFVALERLLNLEEGYRRTFQLAGRNLLLMVVDRQPLLLENRCPHQGVPLHNATLAGWVLRCARHGVEFDFFSGQALNAHCPALTRFELVYDDDRIGVDL
ncbi:Rieske (2Fe-2S) protein [Pseudomonas cavernae]|uniref:Rieske (2Fe-2S) protein n=1 Tax=Pseudomonas cavernae TaxID=2320867 RepID=A0A385Z0I5_9PSED|nr:Rieske (2Fe-2S) protein [Pseudomonas cavernae]AYC32709.1 Rieske (2Fe-2S) protein [Pseudomonas cavernae]